MAVLTPYPVYDDPPTHAADDCGEARISFTWSVRVRLACRRCGAGWVMRLYGIGGDWFQRCGPCGGYTAHTHEILKETD